MKDFDYGARWIYEQFKLRQPHIKTKGLYKLGVKYLILCDNINQSTLKQDEKDIIEWLDKNRPLGTNIELVSNLPNETVKLPERNKAEILSGAGYPRTTNDLYKDLFVELPAEFPMFSIRDGEDQILIIKTTKKLTEKEKELFSDIWNKLNISVDYKFSSGNMAEKEINFNYNRREGDFSLVPSKLIESNLSKNLYKLWEQDEEFWINNRNKIFSDKMNDYYQDYYNSISDNSKCLVNTSVFPADNIRNYLSIYEEVLIVCPIAEYHNKNLNSLGVTEDELIKLMELNRVKLLLPQSIDRYNSRFLNKAANNRPNNMIFSRELACKTVIDIKNRNPFLFTNLNIHERYLLLNKSYNVINQVKNSKFRNLLLRVLIEFARIWSNQEILLNKRGAMSTASLGMAPVTAVMFEEILEKDLKIEFFSSASAVEWAGAFNANLIPIIMDEEESSYSEEGISTILSHIYSGVPLELSYNKLKKNNIVTDNILTIGDYVPVVEFAESFQSGEINRFRKLINGLSKHNYSEDEFNQKLNEFNKEVKRYENRNKFINRINIEGLILDIIGDAIPLAGFIESIIKKTFLTSGRYDAKTGELIDRILSIPYNVTPDAVLVSRLRDNLKNKI